MKLLFIPALVLSLVVSELPIAPKVDADDPVLCGNPCVVPVSSPYVLGGVYVVQPDAAPTAFRLYQDGVLVREFPASIMDAQGKITLGLQSPATPGTYTMTMRAVNSAGESAAGDTPLVLQTLPAGQIKVQVAVILNVTTNRQGNPVFKIVSVEVVK